MTVTMERDDQTPLDATNVRAALTAQRADERVIVHLTHGDGNELLVGLRADRGVCMWQPNEGDGEVTTGGDNGDVTVYGWAGVPFPPNSEIDPETVIDAADEFAATGARPTCVTWTDYHDAMPDTESTITPDELQVLLSGPDTGQ